MLINIKLSADIPISRQLFQIENLQNILNLNKNLQFSSRIIPG